MRKRLIELLQSNLWPSLGAAGIALIYSAHFPLWYWLLGQIDTEMQRAQLDAISAMGRGMTDSIIPALIVGWSATIICPFSP